MLVQWPWGPQEAPELHSFTSAGRGVSAGGQSRDTQDGSLGVRGLEDVVRSVLVEYEVKAPWQKWAGESRFL